MMMFFTVVGIMTCCAFLLMVVGILYWQFVHPFFQAISLYRWNRACQKALDPNAKRVPFWKAFAFYYTVGGWPGERTWNSVGEWRGIGRWKIYEPEEGKAP